VLRVEWEGRSLAWYIVLFLVVWAWTFSSQMWLIFPRGPYMWTAGPFRRVYRVTVRDQGGHQRHGWVRLGRNLWPSMAVDDCPLDVQWDP
jgi:hypothetical protein